jgi:methylthioribose-1-phosphate isomerase
VKQPVGWQDNSLILLDQTRLPEEEIYLRLTTPAEVVEAIKSMRVRGAPAIGVAAGYGIALGVLGLQSTDIRQIKLELQDVIHQLAATRPTARNLFQVTERMQHVLSSVNDHDNLKRRLIAEAIAIHEEQKEADLRISAFGADLLIPGAAVLTHCNTGPLATAGHGTALGVIIEAYRQGKIKSIFVTETRPLCQGARLTAWELQQAEIPFKLITDSMAGYIMRLGLVNTVIVGADRIAANGDTANKIGTYSLAVLAREHKVAFYVAAPVTTLDKSMATGVAIVIEERSPDEIIRIKGEQIAPEGVEVFNPAFDITPSQYINSFITDKGILKPPFMADINP